MTHRTKTRTRGGSNLGLLAVGGVVAGVLFPGGAAAVDVAIVAADETTYLDEVHNKLLMTGEFDTVDVVDARYSTPTLAELQAYHGVLIWSSYHFLSAVDLGDNLADYMDGGGGVVAAVFTFYDAPGGPAIHGRLVTDGYLPTTHDSYATGSHLTLVEDVSDHVLLSGVHSFDGGSSSYHDTVSVETGATLVASWSNGYPLVTAIEPTAAPCVGLNFYPPSSDARSDYWEAATDGDRLLSNALLYVSGALDLDGDGNSALEGDCDETDAEVHPGAEEVCDGVDNDCNGSVDDDVDYDHDGYYGCGGDDCDDENANTHPGAPEWPYNGEDEDCDGADLTDVDGDGFDGGATGEDCDDQDAAVNPDADEDCGDGVDNDCDDQVDAADLDCGETSDDDDAADDDDDDDGGGCTCCEVEPGHASPRAAVLALGVLVGILRRRLPRRVDAR